MERRHGKLHLKDAHGVCGGRFEHSSVLKVADFSKEKAEMGSVHQREGEEGSECCPRLSEEPKELSSETFLGWEGDCPA